MNQVFEERLILVRKKEIGVLMGGQRKKQMFRDGKPWH